MPSLPAGRLPHAAPLYRAIIRLLPWLYLTWLLPVGGIVAAVTPPWQNPDELSHVMRAFEIGYGQWIGHRLDAEHAGGLTEGGVVTSFGAMSGVPFHPQTKVTAAVLKAAAEAKLSTPSLQHFSNTVVYPPFLYLPASLVGRLSRAIGLHAGAALRAMRLSALGLSAAIGTASLVRAARLRIVIAAVLVLPMSLALAASPAQDGLMIALSAWVCAAIDQAWQERAVSLATRLAVAGALLLVVLARPPYLPLLALPLLLPGPVRLSVILAGVAVMAVLAWIAFAEARLSVHMPGVSPVAQFVWLLRHPVGAVRVLLRTLDAQGRFYGAGIAGTFGWLDAPLSHAAVRAVLWGLAAAMLSALVPDRPHGSSAPRVRLCVLLAGFAAAGAVILALYITWTAPGAALVDGVQGRYFLPLLPVLALGLPSLGRHAAILRPLALAATMLLALVGSTLTVTTLIGRYYLAP